LKFSRPCGVVVSIGSLRLFKPILRVINSFTTSIRCLSERPRRSSFQTTRTSPVRRFSNSLLKIGRSAWGAAHDFCIDRGAPSFFEGVDLEIDGLIFRANASVASFHFRPSSDSRRSSVYSYGSNKTNFVFRNQYFGPLKAGFRGENRGFQRVRKNDRFVEPLCAVAIPEYTGMI
jgi:hypothetical protein